MTDCYVIQSTELQGNCLVASRDIACGDQILNEELPFVWQSVLIPGMNFNKHCEECGLVLTKQLMESLSTFINADTVDSGVRILSAIHELMPTKTLLSTLVPKLCIRNCGVEYCSQKCLDLASLKGHDWLCERYQTVSPSIQRMREIDNMGHFGLANKVYANIAAQCLLNVTEDNYIDLSIEAMRVALSLLSEYHFVDFTRTMHAYRTGSMEEIDPDMFQNIIFPAYFESRLATPFALCKETFSQSGRVLWGTGSLGERRSAEFLSSEIFSEQFYSRIIGTFTVNNLSVHVPSPLDFIFSQAVRIQKVTAESSDAYSTNERVIGVLERYYSQQQLQQQHCEEVAGTKEGLPRSPSSSKRFLGMSGSGLFPIFSKTNHSCVCNTSIHGSDHVSVSIRATQAIAQGTEITNCYIHHHSLNGGEAEVGMERATVFNTTANNSDNIIDSSNEQHMLNAKMTKKQRYRALRQYVFECQCPLCCSQVIDSDEDSD